MKSMRRKYRYSDFEELVRKLRSRIPEISIATDVICGFPGESDEDHNLTISMIKSLRMDTINITRFSARPGTDAANMTPVHGRISKDRSAELTAVKNNTEGDVNSLLVGRRYRALATEVGKNGTIVRTDNYRPVVVEDRIELGTFLDVEITDSMPTYLIGKVV